jgi:Rieske Fe-S protein
MSGSSPRQVSRRDFIKVTVAAIGSILGAVIAIPSITYLFSPALEKKDDKGTIDLGPLEDYRIGTPTRFETTITKVNGWERTGTLYGLFVYRKNESDVRVFSDICTHLGCRVSWHTDQEHYISPCHDGHFDIVGDVVSGPPPRPLDEYVVKVENGNLYAQLPPVKRT